MKSIFLQKFSIMKFQTSFMFSIVFIEKPLRVQMLHTTELWWLYQATTGWSIKIQQNYSSLNGYDLNFFAVFQLGSVKSHAGVSTDYQVNILISSKTEVSKKFHLIK